MYVTKITPITKTRYQIWVDGTPAFVLYKAEVSKYNLAEGMCLSEDVFTQIKEVLIKRAKLRALHLLEEMDRTEQSIFQKLRQNGYPEDVVGAAVSYVKSFGYLNDKRYAESYVRSRMHKKSRRELYMALLGKGLQSETVEEALNLCYENMSEKEAIMQIVKKKNFNVEEADDREKKKIFDYLLRKGFRYEDIRQVLQVSCSNT